MLNSLLSLPRPLLLDDCPLPGGLRIAVLGPHPDDFDAIAVTLRLFRDAGNRISVAVLSGGASGVEDGYCELPTDERKVELRRLEQRASCGMFGLPDDALEFLPLSSSSTWHRSGQTSSSCRTATTRSPATGTSMPWSNRRPRAIRRRSWRS